MCCCFCWWWWWNNKSAKLDKEQRKEHGSHSTIPEFYEKTKDESIENRQKVKPNLRLKWVPAFWYYLPYFFFIPRHNYSLRIIGHHYNISSYLTLPLSCLPIFLLTFHTQRTSTTASLHFEISGQTLYNSMSAPQEKNAHNKRVRVMGNITFFHDSYFVNFLPTTVIGFPYRSGVPVKTLNAG